ncbi:MAG: ABC transporter substrate-binding protein [Candidatus Krumholzibacteriia bacterium]
MAGLACAAAAACVGCSGPDPEPVIGFAFLPSAEDQIVVAEEEIAAWGVAGGPVPRIAPDPQPDGDSAEQEVRRAMRLLAVEGLVGVVGHAGSRGSLVTAPLYNEAEVVQLVPTGTHSSLAEAGPWTFRLAPDDDAIARRMAGFAAGALGARSVTVCHVADEYGTGLAEALLRECARRGLPVLDTFAYTLQSDAATLVAGSLRRGVPDVVLLVGRDLGAGRFMRAFGEAAPGRRFVGGDGIEFRPAFAEAAGAGADSLYAVTFWHSSRPDSVSQAFVARYERLLGRTPGPVQAMRHDALVVLARAARETRGEPEAMRAWLQELGVARPAHRGVTGPISFAPDRHLPLQVVRRRGGTLALVAEPEGADGR